VSQVLNSYSITGEQLSIYVLHDESTSIRNLWLLPISESMSNILTRRSLVQFNFSEYYYVVTLSATRILPYW
jgi:hypothetical protein